MNPLVVRYGRGGVCVYIRTCVHMYLHPFSIHFLSLPPSLPPSLCSRSNPNEGGRPAISAYWADYTQAQLGAMMATVSHCHRQPIFIEQSEAILVGPREATHLPTWRFFFKHYVPRLTFNAEGGIKHKAPRHSFFVQWIHQLIGSQHASPKLF